MALDDFMDGIETEETSTTSSSRSEPSQQTKQDILELEGVTEYDDGDVGHRGPFGYQTHDEFEETIVGDLEPHGDLFKYYLPIFPHIEMKDKYQRGKRYECAADGITGGPATCVSKQKVKLVKVNREVVMLDTGKTKREKCVEVLEERFDQELLTNSEVYLYFFAKIRHLVKIAIGDELTDSWSTYPKDALLKAVYGEEWTQRFRSTGSERYNTKHINHIEEW